MSCDYARPEPLTQIYGAVSTTALVAFALAYRHAAALEEKPGPQASAPLLASPARETWVDSMRFVLIVFIVMGHYAAIPCSYIAEQSFWLGPLLAWINLFVMPGFAALSGYLSKGPLTQARLSRVLIYVLAPYVLSKMIYWVWFSLEYRMIGWFDPFDAFSNSLGLEWYLIVLVQWRLAIALMSPLNKWTLFGSSLFIGLVSGNWVPGSAALAMSRACAFFPFFVLGYILDLAHWREVLTRNIGCKVLLRSSFLGALAVFFCNPGIANLFMSNTLGDLNFDYSGSVPSKAINGPLGPTGLMQVVGPVARANCGSEWILSFVHRLVRYELGVVLVLGLIAWMPSFSAMAQYGKFTMYPYLLHPWVFQLWLLPLMNRHLPALLGSLVPFAAGGYVWGFTIIWAPVLTMALSSAPVRLLTGPYIEPGWLGRFVLSSENQIVSGKAESRTAGLCETLAVQKASV